MRTSWLPYPSLSRSDAVAANREATFSLGHAAIFYRPVLGAALVVAFLAAIYHITPLLALAVSFVALGTGSWLWSRQSLRGLSFKAALNQTRAFPDEAVDLTLELANDKWLPLTWLEIEQELPWRLVTGVLRASSPYSRERLRWTTSVSGRQRIKWVHRVECKARGEYRLGPVRLRSGDIFGLYPREAVLPCFEQLLVYPRIIPVDKLNLPMKQLVGERSAPRSIYEDSSRTMGTRDYHHGDPLKRIHWKASARCSQLRTRQYESTTDLSLLLILDVQSFCQQEGEDVEAFELAVSTAASLAYEADRERSLVGLMANSVPEIRIPVSAGRDHLLVTLEALARIEPRSRLSLHQYLGKDVVNLPLGATLLIIARGPSSSLSGMVQELSRRGHSVLPLTIRGDTSEPDIGGGLTTSAPSASSPARGFAELRP